MVLEWEWKEQLVYSQSWENWENLNIKGKLYYVCLKIPLKNGQLNQSCNKVMTMKK